MRRWNVTWYYWWRLFNRNLPWMHGEIIENKFINFDLHFNWRLRTNRNVSFKWVILINQSDLMRSLNDLVGYGLILADFTWMKKEMVISANPSHNSNTTFLSFHILCELFKICKREKFWRTDTNHKGHKQGSKISLDFNLDRDIKVFKKWSEKCHWETTSLNPNDAMAIRGWESKDASDLSFE